jgi:hypothetical protein
VGWYNTRRLLKPIGNMMPTEAEALYHIQPEPAARAEYEARRAACDAKKGRRGRPPKPPEDDPPPTRQSNLTDPDSALMRRSDAHEYRQAYNAEAWSAPRARNSSSPPI